ncbi:helix-turn-helix domain-containing protein [Streptacidiphilus sp. NEAU-YB345]|uniref:Helix-turn-helix domain-containing protein n=2 Tax=Streptacidiphilus fuscans TaxID=2789292 RepID=A0A931FKB7_9ACTN|nr:helix-turn-helix domain-containing protein [Streptacidiphilus fuscans]
MDLTDTVGSLRSQTKALHEDVRGLHEEALFKDWQHRTARRAKTAPLTLLDELARLGFSWRDVARMLGVSVPAVQKWRRSGGITGHNRRNIANLLALCDLISERYLVEEIASWFEMPISGDAPLTPTDLYAEGRMDILFDHASGHGDPEQMLTDYDGAWRERFRSDFEVYEESDGELSIRLKDK